MLCVICLGVTHRGIIFGRDSQTTSGIGYNTPQWQGRKEEPPALFIGVTQSIKSSGGNRPKLLRKRL